MLLIVSQLFLLLTLEGTHALEHLIPVDEGAIKLRTIDADELCLATNGESAGTTHTCTIHHNRIQRYFAGDIVLLGSEVRELHHDWRSDGEYLVNMLLFDELLDTNGYHTFLAIASVIRHDDYLIRALTNLILKDNQILRTTSHHTQDAVAGSLQCLDDRQHRGNTQTTTCTNDSTIILNLRGITQRTYHVGYIITCIQCAEFLRRKTHHLDHQCDRTFLDVSASDGQRHTLTFLTYAYDDEITSLTALGNQRSLNLKEENLLRELLFSYNLVHNICLALFSR